MAKWLGAPVLLVVDCWAMARSAAAMVRGYQEFDPDLCIGGLLLNRVCCPIFCGSALAFARCKLGRLGPAGRPIRLRALAHRCHKAKGSCLVAAAVRQRTPCYAGQWGQAPYAKHLMPHRSFTSSARG